MIGNEYRHYKGNKYTVLNVATEEDTGGEVIVYQGADGRVWVTPSLRFRPPRFTLIGHRTACPKCGSSLEFYVHRICEPMMIEYRCSHNPLQAEAPLCDWRVWEHDDQPDRTPRQVRQALDKKLEKALCP